MGCTATVLYYATVQYCVVQGGGGHEGQAGLAAYQVGGGRQGHRRLEKKFVKGEKLINGLHSANSLIATSLYAIVFSLGFAFEIKT